MGRSGQSLFGGDSSSNGQTPNPSNGKKNGRRRVSEQATPAHANEDSPAALAAKDNEECRQNIDEFLKEHPSHARGAWLAIKKNIFDPEKANGTAATTDQLSADIVTEVEKAYFHHTIVSFSRVPLYWLGTWLIENVEGLDAALLGKIYDCDVETAKA